MENQIKELNSLVLTKIAPSSVHGCGVFALRDIKKGETLFADMMTRLYSIPYEFFDGIRPEVRKLLLERWPQIVNGSKFLFPDTRIQAFMNHSSTPNYDAQTDKVLKDIEEGEEIFEDYKKIPSYEKVFPWLVDKKEK